MKSSVKQTKIPFTERKLRVRNKCVTPKKYDSSDDDKSPLKYKLIISSGNKITLRRSSACRSERPVHRSQDRSSKNEGSPKQTPKRRVNKSEKGEDVDCPTPSKRKCCPDEIENEKTPEKRKNAVTPSTMLSRLQLSSTKKPAVEDSSPKTNRSKNEFQPKQLFPSSNASSARKALYSSSNSLPCREDEVKRLHNFLEKHLDDQTCGSIYISGLPGTGKTASIEHVIQTEKLSKGYNIVKINCTSVSSSASIYKRICSGLKIKTAGKTEKDPKVLIEKYLLRKHKMILLILDEIDQLETRSQSVLYKIFEWPSWPKAKLVLIGIANAMDLTDRILPRLCAKVELKPVLLHFTPYSKDQIKEILSHRLSEVGASDIFTPSAIELISAKVASVSGDVRRALDLGRRVVEISEESKAGEKLTANKIDPNGINTNLLTDFLKSEGCRRSPRKRDPNVESYANGQKPNPEPSRDVESTPTKPSKALFLSPGGKQTPSSSPHSRRTPQSKKKLFDDDHTEEGVGVLRELNYNRDGGSGESRAAVSPLKLRLCKRGQGGVASPAKTRESPRKHSVKGDDSTDVKSPGEVNFSVDFEDVFDVLKNIYGSSKSLKSTSEDSSFPLHQKILVCTFLLISKKGKTKDLNVGRLHQVYTKICTKRGITPVDLSGFLFLCRQVEMTGLMQIGKGQGKLARISLQWDEAEVTDALKDLNLLSSILNDVSCL